MLVNLDISSIVKIDHELDSITRNYKKLNNHVLPKIWIIASNEDLLKKQIISTIKRKFFSKNKFDHILKIPNLNFNWSNLLLESMSNSLFSNEKLFDVRLITGKPGTIGSKLLIEWSKKIKTSSYLMLSLPIADSTIRKSSWFKSIDKVGITLLISSPSTSQIRNWVEKKFFDYKINSTCEAIDLMTQNCEGNLSMADQHIKKICLIVKSKKQDMIVDNNLVQEMVFNFSKYNPFTLPDLVFRKNSKKKCIQAIRSLKGSPKCCKFLDDVFLNYQLYPALCLNQHHHQCIYDRSHPNV